jgi:large subunit ribosomal protein L24
MAKADKAARQGKAKPPALKIKKGDRVIVIAGKDRGREGTVILADPVKSRVLVQGVNMMRKNTKVDYQGGRGGRSYKDGGIINTEAPIHVSNVQLIDPETKKPARVGYRAAEGKKVRITRPGGKEI